MPRRKWTSRTSGRTAWPWSSAARRRIGFFFQAEDGIRDHCVTGVQTCALPISFSTRSYSAIITQGAEYDRVENGAKVPLPLGSLSSCRYFCRSLSEVPSGREPSSDDRSEERHVGKSVDLGGRRMIQ